MSEVLSGHPAPEMTISVLLFQTVKATCTSCQLQFRKEEPMKKKNMHKKKKKRKKKTNTLNKVIELRSDRNVIEMDIFQ